MKEIHIESKSGIPMLVIMVAIIALTLVLLISDDQQHGLLMAGGILTILASAFVLSGLYKVEPNQAAVLSLFGKYKGTVTTAGLRWNNPFYTKRKVSLRVRNFESGKLKVNELEGSPIEIAAIVVWQVIDSAEAVFNVDDFESFVQIQSESAVRSMATVYPYDQQVDGDVSLRSHAQEISAKLMTEIQEHLTEAGVRIIEARISHLAYAPEIAQAMLQRQQASAIIAARTRIVEGAVGMVEMALEQLKNKGVVDLDEERRAMMVSNLLVVLCSDKATQPIVNTGSLY